LTEASAEAREALEAERLETPARGWPASVASCPQILERLFHGHGVASNKPWFVNIIEPNFAGATAIAEHWYELLTSR
jgi:hypothetical protein